MSLTRKLLESLGIDEDKVAIIIGAHAETVDALKGQIENYKGDAERALQMEKDLSKAMKELEELKTSGGDWQAKFDSLSNEYEAYKTEQTEKAAHEAKLSAYRELLASAGINEKTIPSILKVADVNNFEIEDGKLKDSEAITEQIKQDWNGFIVTEETAGAKTQTPPGNDTPARYTREQIATMTPEEINKNWEAVSASL